MIESLRGRRRTHRCGDLRPEHAGMRARLAGWAHRVRDHGGVIFLDLRDRFGITQVVFRPEHLGEEVMQRARSIGSEYVVFVEGKVLNRPRGSEKRDQAARRAALRQAPGALPVLRLKARLNAGSDSYPTRVATTPTGRSVVCSRWLASWFRQRAI